MHDSALNVIIYFTRNWLKLLAEDVRLWQAVYGGTVTISPSSRIMSLPWGVRTSSLSKET
ncbi:MAG: hypothetical protein JRJ46_08000 [Deltaproteobacteria bacterium]|nr:hypothetical protein [Deltaproteobacteria bacterium]